MGGNITSEFPNNIPKNEFDKFFEDHELAEHGERLFYELTDDNHTVKKADMLALIENAKDVFLSHNWGEDNMGRDNHHRVAKINNALVQLGYETWFDQSDMKGNIKDAMREGILSSQCFIVFLTQNYMKKANGKSEKGKKDNCHTEFSTATEDKGLEKIVTVIMDPECLDSKTWSGEIRSLARQLYIDFTSDDKLHEAVERLDDALKNILKKKIADRKSSTISTRLDESQTQSRTAFPVSTVRVFPVSTHDYSQTKSHHQQHIIPINSSYGQKKVRIALGVMSFISFIIACVLTGEVANEVANDPTDAFPYNNTIINAFREDRDDDYYDDYFYYDDRTYYENADRNFQLSMWMIICWVFFCAFMLGFFVLSLWRDVRQMCDIEYSRVRNGFINE